MHKQVVWRTFQKIWILPVSTYWKKERKLPMRVPCRLRRVSTNVAYLNVWSSSKFKSQHHIAKVPIFRKVCQLKEYSRAAHQSRITTWHKKLHLQSLGVTFLNPSNYHIPFIALKFEGTEVLVWSSFCFFWFLNLDFPLMELLPLDRLSLFSRPAYGMSLGDQLKSWVSCFNFFKFWISIWIFSWVFFKPSYWMWRYKNPSVKNSSIVTNATQNIRTSAFKLHIHWNWASTWKLPILSTDWRK